MKLTTVKLLSPQALAAAVVLLKLATAVQYPSSVATGAPLLPQGAGAWFGSTFDINSESVSAYFKRIGISPAIIQIFVPLPLDDGTRGYLWLVISQATAVKAAVLITVTPWNGLAAVTEASASELAWFIHQFEQVQSS